MRCWSEQVEFDKGLLQLFVKKNLFQIQAENKFRRSVTENETRRLIFFDLKSYFDPEKEPF